MHRSGRAMLAVLACCGLMLPPAMWPRMSQSRAGAISAPPLPASSRLPIRAAYPAETDTYPLAVAQSGLPLATVTEANYPCDTGCTYALLFLFAGAVAPPVERLAAHTQGIAAVYRTGVMSSVVVAGYCYVACLGDVYATDAGTATVRRLIHLPGTLRLTTLERCPIGFTLDHRWYALRAVPTAQATDIATLVVTAQAAPLPRC